MRTAGNILPSGHVLFPWTVMVSHDGSHFAVLDQDCSLGVYKGDVDVLMRTLLYADHANFDAENLFYTPRDSALDGHCFAGVDDAGVFRIFAGHPDFEYTPIWESDSSSTDDLSSHYTRHYVEITNDGELAVLRISPGESEASCVWSTTSCNHYVALLVDLSRDTLRFTRAAIRGIARLLHIIVKEVRQVVNSDDPLRTLTKKIGRLWESIISSLEQ